MKNVFLTLIVRKKEKGRGRGRGKEKKKRRKNKKEKEKGKKTNRMIFSTPQQLLEKLEKQGCY